MSDDPCDLARFRSAQEPVYEAALGELQAGRKTSHWMWFVFPQIAGLGFSAMAERYAIASLDEARAYLADPILGPRLSECVEALLANASASAEDMLGEVDALKLRSSLTLFRAADPGQPLFQRALDRFFEGEGDPHTLARLG
jgi:uncharacterized protein (DUF1810 family)